LAVRVIAEEQWRIHKELLRRIKLALDAAGVSPPFAAMPPPTPPPMPPDGAPTPETPGGTRKKPDEPADAES